MDSVERNVSKLREVVKDREAWHAAVHGVTESEACWTRPVVLAWSRLDQMIRMQGWRLGALAPGRLQTLHTWASHSFFAAVVRRSAGP